MSKAQDKLFAEFDKYILAMGSMNKAASALYVTRKQWNELGLNLALDKDRGVPRYKGIEVKIHG